MASLRARAFAYAAHDAGSAGGSRWVCRLDMIGQGYFATSEFVKAQRHGAYQGSRPIAGGSLIGPCAETIGPNLSSLPDAVLIGFCAIRCPAEDESAGARWVCCK